MSDTTVNEFRPQRADAVTAPITEDWLAVVLGLSIFVLALAAVVNVDLIGWVVTTSVWSNLSQALKATSKDFSSLGGIGGELGGRSAQSRVGIGDEGRRTVAGAAGHGEKHRQGEEAAADFCAIFHGVLSQIVWSGYRTRGPRILNGFVWGLGLWGFEEHFRSFTFNSGDGIERAAESSVFALEICSGEFAFCS